MEQGEGQAERRPWPGRGAWTTEGGFVTQAQFEPVVHLVERHDLFLNGGADKDGNLVVGIRTAVQSLLDESKASRKLVRNVGGSIVFFLVLNWVHDWTGADLATIARFFGHFVGG